jgi:hypothetical protein
MHTSGGSWWDEFIAPGNHLLYPQATMPMTWHPVNQDQLLAKLDPRDPPEKVPHLHRSVRHMGDGTEYSDGMLVPSIPSSFDNYQRFRDDLPRECNKAIAFHWLKDECWIGVLRGMPRKGQLVRRIN